MSCSERGWQLPDSLFDLDCLCEAAIRGEASKINRSLGDATLDRFADHINPSLSP
jgi:hypothetical protein